ncbi:MAG TPA: ABC transporter permease [Blastocatellia bacterium]|nr:ABC transporter permease [Blastocatellia bacterium]
MRALWQDLRYGVRTLIKKPGFSLVAVVVLALGIGANTAIFSVVYGILLRPLPYKDPDRIITVWQNDPKTGANQVDCAPANFIDWRDRNQVFEQMALAEPYSHDLTGQGEPETFRSWLVSEGFFEVLGATALHGRVFQPDDYRPGNDRVVVISYDLWKRRFGSDPGLVGQELLLRNQPYTVVGILPPALKFPPESNREAWAPRVFRDSDRQNRASTYMKVIGRLRPGTTLEQAREEMRTIASHLADEYPRTNAGTGITLVPLPEQLVGQVRPALLVLLGAVAFVLLIACANVASLLLVRGAERHRELAIRAALGASRTRLVRQMFTESFLLAVTGGLGGVLLAIWGVDLIIAISPEDLPRLGEVGIDTSVLAFTFAVSVITAIIFGLAPSIQFSKPDLQESLKEGGRTATDGARRHLLRNALVVTEIALALVLLVGAGLLIRSFTQLTKVDPGFVSERALALEVHIWSRSRVPAERAAFFDQALQRISQLPGVESAGTVLALPFVGDENSIDIDPPFTIAGRPPFLEGQEPTAYLSFTGGDYFKAIGIPLLAGRPFSKFDNQEAPVAFVISESMVRRHFTDEDPIGKRMTVNYGRGITGEIVGVVGDVRHSGFDSEPRPEIYMHHPQNPYGSMTFVVRTTGDPTAMIPAIKNEIWAVRSDQPISRIATVDDLISKSLEHRRFNLLLLSLFAAIALILAAVGIYGLISFSTSQRTHEIGVRMALGARAADIWRLVIGRGLLLISAGLCAGLAASLALTRLLSGMLYGVSATDVTTFAVVSLVLAAVGLAACYIPARRAMKVDPMVALRYE